MLPRTVLLPSDHPLRPEVLRKAEELTRLDIELQTAMLSLAEAERSALASAVLFARHDIAEKVDGQLREFESARLAYRDALLAWAARRLPAAAREIEAAEARHTGFARTQADLVAEEAHERQLIEQFRAEHQIAAASARPTTAPRRRIWPSFTRRRGVPSYVVQYERRLNELQKKKMGIADVVTAKKRTELELQRTWLRVQQLSVGAPVVQAAHRDAESALLTTADAIARECLPDIYATWLGAYGTDRARSETLVAEPLNEAAVTVTAEEAEDPTPLKREPGVEFDVFISHASEDKDSVARPLRIALEQLGLNVWLDEQELTLGDSLSQKIDEGLARSRYGVVVLSRSFFGKQWPRRELDGLVARETLDGEKVILPVWHEVGPREVSEFSPPLGGRLAVATSGGVDVVAKSIAQAVARGRH